jgi:hypothetical protein
VLVGFVGERGEKVGMIYCSTFSIFISKRRRGESYVEMDRYGREREKGYL